MAARERMGEGDMEGRTRYIKDGANIYTEARFLRRSWSLSLDSIRRLESRFSTTLRCMRVFTSMSRRHKGWRGEAG